MAHTKKVKASGRLKRGYGTVVRNKLVVVESKQRKRQTCPFCKKHAAKRLSSGIWKCRKCNKNFTGGAYYLE